MKRKPKRGYSREFSANGDGRAYKLAGIPDDLWTAFREKCTRERVSVRAKLLTLVKADVEAGA